MSFIKSQNVPVDDTVRGAAVTGCDGASGSFSIAPTDKTGRDFRAKGRLTYVGKHYLQFAATKEYFLKAGADAPENFLAYREFDGDFPKDGHKDNLVKDWKPHVQDWKRGDPTWQNGKGRGIIGAVNYLASKGANAVSFLTMNIGGDDQNVFPGTVEWTGTGQEKQWQGIWRCSQCGRAQPFSCDTSKMHLFSCSNESCSNYGYLRISRRL